MVYVTIAALIATTIIAAEMRAHHSWQHRLAAIWLNIQTIALPATHVTLDQSQLGHVVRVNDDLLLIRHTSGRLAFLPIRHPAPTGPSTSLMVKMLAFVFFFL